MEKEGNDFMLEMRKRQKYSQRVEKINEDSFIEEIRNNMIPLEPLKRGGDKYLKDRGASPYRKV